MYRILHATHPRVGDAWCIYPMYDFAHGQSDSIEKITHSVCTLEFEAHRPLYDWFIDSLDIYHPQQIEFARLSLSYTVMSKRKLLQLVNEKHVSGWDDPRMPTISGLRRRGYTPESIRDFADRIGVAKSDNVVEMAFLEHCLREDLNKRALRVMGVMRPVKLVILNYPENQAEELDAVNNPEDESAGTRKIPFSRVLYIEREDFMEDPPKKFFRLAPGREVRLRYAYFVRCENVIKDPKTGEIMEIHCTYDPETKGGNAPDGRKVKATLHWVSADHAVRSEARLYNNLFLTENPNSGDFKESINPDSLEIVDSFMVEPGLHKAPGGIFLQFERIGYFNIDPVDSTPDHLIFNRTVQLKDSWARIQKAEQSNPGK